MTLYVDVYVLINFTVDLLAIFFALRLNRIFTKTYKIVLAAAIGSFQALLYVIFFEGFIFGALFSLFYFAFLSVFIARRVSFIRKIKFTAAFCLLEILIGGLVYFLYLQLNKYVDLDKEGGGAENRRLLIFAVLVLLAIGFLKLTITVLTSAKTERTVLINVLLDGRKSSVSCFVDSGNLAYDLLDKSPAVFLSRKAFLRIFGTLTLPCEKYKSKMRLIPVKQNGKTRLYYGIKCEDVRVEHKGDWEKESVVLVLGDEENYGGYEGLAPSVIATR